MPAVADRTLKRPDDLIKITGEQALARLTADCKFPEDRARRVLNIAWEFSEKAEPCPGGYVHVYYLGQPGGLAQYDARAWAVVEHIGPSARKGLAGIAEREYTQRKQTIPSGTSRTRKGKTMATSTQTRSRRRTAPQPEPEPEANGEVDFERYLAKPLTPTMQDYAEWFEAEVSPLADLRRDLPRILYLGVTLYSHFQKSDFNVERREARRAERDERAQADAEPEPARPAARRGRKPAAATTEPASGNGARRGRKPAAKAADEPETPARRGRKPAAKTAAAKASASAPTRRRRTGASGSDADAPF